MVIYKLINCSSSHHHHHHRRSSRMVQAVLELLVTSHKLVPLHSTQTNKQCVLWRVWGNEGGAEEYTKWLPPSGAQTLLTDGQNKDMVDLMIIFVANKRELLSVAFFHCPKTLVGLSML